MPTFIEIIKNIITSDTCNVEKTPVECCDGHYFTFWWPESHFEYARFSHISGKSHNVQNKSKSYGIFERGSFPLIMAQDTPNKKNNL